VRERGALRVHFVSALLTAAENSAREKN